MEGAEGTEGNRLHKQYTQLLYEINSGMRTETAAAAEVVSGGGGKTNIVVVTEKEITQLTHSRCNFFLLLLLVACMYIYFSNTYL
jgi:hypothetical protein